MKTTLLFNRAVWFLLAVTHGQSIKCYTCHDSEHNPSCRRRMNKIDCSLEKEFGEYFDSCFSMIAINGKKKMQIKNCAMGFGCKELEDALCENFMSNKENSTSWKSCRVECCEGDYCNKYVVGQSNSARILTTQTILLSSFVIIYFLVFVSPW